MRIRVVCSLVRAFLDGVRPLRTYVSRLTVPDQGRRGRARVFQGVLTLLLGFSLAFLVAMIGFNYYTYQTLGSLLDLPFLGMFLAAFAGFSLLFLVGSIGLSSIIYRGKDIKLVSTMPVTEVELLASRLLIAYILHLPLYIGIVLPGIVIAAFLQGVSVLFVLGSFALLLLGPLLPLSLALLVATALLRLSKGRRFKLLEQLFSFVVIVGFSLAMITAFSRNMEDGSSFRVDYQSMLLSVGSSFSTLTRAFPLFVGQAKMLWALPSLGFHALLLLVLPASVCLVVGRGYAHSLSLVASAQSTTGKKAGRHRSFRVMSQTRSLMIRDLEVIRGESVFMIELIGELLIPLILLGVYALTGVLGELQGMASLVATSPYLPYGLFMVVALVSGISMLSSTSVSRQGPQFALDLVLPIRTRVLIRAKVLLHLVLVGGTNLLYLTLGLLFFRLSLAHLLWMGPLILLVVSSASCFGLAIDYKRPLLTWSIPQQAMKSNLNGLLGMLASLGVLLLVGSALVVPLAFGALPVTGIALSYGVAAALCVSAWKIALRYASLR